MHLGPMSNNQSSHAGLPSFSFCLNYCIRSTSLAAVCECATICSVVWVRGHWSRDTSSDLSCIFYFYFYFFCIMIEWISKGSSPQKVSRSNFLVPSFIESILCAFPCSTSLVRSEEIFQTFCKGITRFIFFPINTVICLSNFSTQSYSSWFSSARASSDTFSWFKAINSGHAMVDMANCGSLVSNVSLLRPQKYSSKSLWPTWLFPLFHKGPYFSTMEAILWYGDPTNLGTCPGKISLKVLTKVRQDDVS